MNIINWNIRWGGKGKEALIGEELAKYDSDLIILTEYKNNYSGEHIKSDLHSRGYTYSICSSQNINKNGVAAFSKTPLTSTCNKFTDIENVCVFNCKGLIFIGVFCANDIVTARFIDDIQSFGTFYKTIIVGDLNTGPRGSMPDRYCDLNRITAKGFIDIWRHTSKHIFWSYQSDSGKSQPDHALCSIDLSGNNWKVNYDINPIEKGISDHAIMVIKSDYNTM